MPLDSFIDSPFGFSWHPTNGNSPSDLRMQQPEASLRGGNGTQTNSQQQIYGPFANAHNFSIINPTMVETLNMITMGRTVLDHLEPYTMLDATMDSSARYPPPTCHPGTRRYIGNKLTNWLYNDNRRWRMIWLHGYAGTGKSAIAQTFAERCDEWGRLGGSYFFSRSNKRNRLETVIPTLAYQLAVTVPEYKSIITAKLANDPLLLKKAPPVQFKKFILEPFSALQCQRTLEPIVIILDGLDECEGERAQLEIINMITEGMRLKQDLPLLWLICSRPEAHLKYTFSRIGECGREELVVDAECRSDVERYLRYGLSEIKAEYQLDVTPASWPDEDQVTRLIHAASGLFILAYTILRYIGDRTCADPVDQLNNLMIFLGTAEVVGSNNPLAALDLLYMRILNEISDRIFPTTWRILAHLIYVPAAGRANLPCVRTFCNFLRLDQHTFYSALRRLHSVIEVPDPRNPGARLWFHHTSFQDFLLNPNRAGKFVIEEKKARFDIAKSYLHWYNADLTLHNNGGWEFDWDHKHDSLPGLAWLSASNEQDTSKDLVRFTHGHCWWWINQLDMDHELFSRICDLDFRYCYDSDIMLLADWLYKACPSNTLLRTEPSGGTDLQLLEYFRVMTKNGYAKPATFPLNWPHRARKRVREYFFIGYGSKAIVVWNTEVNGEHWIQMLNSDKEPTAEQVDKYEKDLERMKWYDGTEDS